MKSRKMFHKKDALLIILLVGITLGLWIAAPFLFAQDENENLPAHAIIHYGEHVIWRLPLDEEQIFSLPEHPAVIFEVRAGSVAFIKSDCPDQICVHTGFIDSPWHFAACLPNRLMLSIESTQNNDVDSVVR